MKGNNMTSNFLANTTLVSVIVPVYRVEDYLDECVRSILNQTYKNLEIILVDDGSPDLCGAMCDEYAKQDSRIIVIHKANGGLSDARNAGINIARGEYLLFVDSDDVINQEAISFLIQSCQQNNADIAITGGKRFSNKLPDTKTVATDDVICVSAQEAMKRMMLNQKIGHEAWGKLYKKELWECERFPVGKLYEDYATTYKIVTNSKKVVILDKALYYYRVRPGSIMQNGMREKELQILDVAEEITKYIAKKMPNMKELAEYLQLVTYLKTMKRILDEGFGAYTDEQRQIMSFARSCCHLMNKEWARRVDKIKLKSLLMSKRLFYIIYTIGEQRNKKKLL